MAAKEIHKKRHRHGQIAKRYFSDRRSHPKLFICHQISVTRFINTNFLN